MSSSRYSPPGRQWSRSPSLIVVLVTDLCDRRTKIWLAEFVELRISLYRYVELLACLEGKIALLRDYTNKFMHLQFGKRSNLYEQKWSSSKPNLT
ncbi:hypothetical protein L484_018559 [Morus notabilis]|uniref:Uncharacterized protein n=1 Tax=Morus notabilis TaxID=981085 RepID=W9QRT0_9ROSA|nr:hypothetical protein L484_018559 [Morus notabilis]